MSYSTREEVLEMLKNDTLNAFVNDLFHDEEESTAQLGPVIDEAIADADGEIDGYLCKRYPVPLVDPPKIINKFSKDITLYNLFSRIGIDKDSREEIFLTRYNAAIKFLTLLAEGKVNIGAESDDLSAAAAAGFTVKSNPRLFSREYMRGM